MIITQFVIKMSENKSCDMSDDLPSLEMPLKKRKDSRLCNSPSTSWRIENSQTGNPLKKRFFRSQLSHNENESSPHTSVKKKTNFLSSDMFPINTGSAANGNKIPLEANGTSKLYSALLDSYYSPGDKSIFKSNKEEENMFPINTGSTANGNKTPLEENGTKLYSALLDSYFTPGDKSIFKFNKEDEDYLDAVKSDYKRYLPVKNEHNLKVRKLEPPLHNFTGMKHMPYLKKSPVNTSSIIPGVQDLSCKNSSLSSRIHLNESKKLLDAPELLGSLYNDISDPSKKVKTTKNPDSKSKKTEESNLIPETNKMTMRCKEERNWFDNTRPASKHNINGNTEKPMLNSGSLPVLSQDKVITSSLLSNDVDKFCKCGMNAASSQSSPHKVDSLLSQESHSRSSGAFELSLQPSENMFSFNKDNYVTSSNLSDPEHELTSEIKKESKYYNRPTSLLDNIYNHSNPIKSPWDFSLLLKNTVSQHDKVSELRGKNEAHNIGEITPQENADRSYMMPLKSPPPFHLCESSENSVPQNDATSEIFNNSGVSSSPSNADYKSPLFFSMLLKGKSNKDNVPSQHESQQNVGASSSQEKSSALDVRFFKCLDNIRNNEDTHFLPINCSKDKKDNTFSTCTENSDKQLLHHLPQFNIAKDKATEEKMLLNSQSELQQNLLCETDRESKDKLKYFSPYLFSKRMEERVDDDELENTLIEVCKEQQRNSTQDTTVTENTPEQKTLLNNQNKLQRSFFHEYDKESKDKPRRFPPGLLTRIRKEDKLKNALIEVCEEELKNSFEETSLTDAETNELEDKLSSTSPYKVEGSVIDLCSNNDRRMSDDGNEGDDDVKVIEVFNNQNSTDPMSSKMSNASELDSFQSVFQDRPSTSKCHSKHNFPNLPLDMTNPGRLWKKSAELLPSSSYTGSGSDQIDENEREKKAYPWDPILPSSNDEYLSVSSPESVISISSSSSPSLSPPHLEPNHPIERTIEDEIFGSLIKVMDRNRRKRPTLLKRAKEIPILTVPEDESSDEEMNMRYKKPKVSEKVRKVNSSPQATSTRNELECAVCLESMSSKRGTSATTCGHVYCTPCIDQVIEKKGECPTCRKALDSTQVHKLFLFA